MALQMGGVITTGMVVTHSSGQYPEPLSLHPRLIEL